MDAELKAKLKEHAKKKRSGTILLKDIPPSDFYLATDAVKDGTADPMFTPTESIVGRKVAYLSRATVSQLDALSQCIPHAEVRISCRMPPYDRIVRVFDYQTLCTVLRFLGIQDCSKYIKLLLYIYEERMSIHRSTNEQK